MVTKKEGGVSGSRNGGGGRVKGANLWGEKVTEKGDKTRRAEGVGRVYDM